MAAKYAGELPDILANEGLPSGTAAPDDILWDHPTEGEIKLIKKGHTYNSAFLSAVQDGAKSGKPKPGENKSVSPDAETK